MKDKLPEKYEQCRVKHLMYVIPDYGDIQGCFSIKFKNKTLCVISGNAEDWGHISVSLKHRCPTWEEMCFIKDIFFDKEEQVIQFHPQKSKYKNFHKFCLHLWQPKFAIQLPPEEYI